MKYEITEAQVGERPHVTLPNKEIYETLGEEGMRQLISDHYDLLKQSSIKHLFPPSDEAFEMAKKHSADFFIQICGGPQHFSKNRGAPRMVARHAPFSITKEARKIWLEEYAKVIDKLTISEELKASYWEYIDVFSIWMMNTSEN